MWYKLNHLLLLFCMLSYYSLARGYVRKKVANQNRYLRVCYYSSGDPEPDRINGTLCTHVIGGFSVITDGVFDVGSAEKLERYIKTVALKNIYPHLKVMVSIGGGGNDTPFSDAVATIANRKKLIESIVSFLRKYNIDGLDIDWEFPVWNDGVSQDKENFILFLKEFRENYSNTTSNLLLSVAVGAPKTIIDKSYDIPLLAKYVDFINLMSYDYHDYTFYTPFTGHNSPLFNRSVEHAYFATLNTAWSALYWFHKGMPKEKIMVGLPTYGHTYTLLDPELHGFDAPATGFGIGNGSTTFPGACQFLNDGGTRVFDEQSQVPYAYHNHNWIAYDDSASILVKAEWVKKMRFGGVMTFDLNCDDWLGLCDGMTKFPLHQIIYDVLTTSHEKSSLS